MGQILAETLLLGLPCIILKITLWAGIGFIKKQFF